MKGGLPITPTHPTPTTAPAPALDSPAPCRAERSRGGRRPHDSGPDGSPDHRRQGFLCVAPSYFPCGQMTPWRQSRPRAPGLRPVLPSLREKALSSSSLGRRSSAAAVEPGLREHTPQRGPSSLCPSRAPRGPRAELKTQLGQTPV